MALVVNCFGEHLQSNTRCVGWRNRPGTDDASCEQAAAALFYRLDNNSTGAVHESQVLPLWPTLTQYVEGGSFAEWALQIKQRVVPIFFDEWMALMDALRSVVGSRRFKTCVRRAEQLAAKGRPSPTTQLPPLGTSASAPLLLVPGSIDTTPKARRQLPGLEYFPLATPQSLRKVASFTRLSPPSYELMEPLTQAGRDMFATPLTPGSSFPLQASPSFSPTSGLTTSTNEKAAQVVDTSLPKKEKPSATHQAKSQDSPNEAQLRAEAKSALLRAATNGSLASVLSSSQEEAPAAAIADSAEEKEASLQRLRKQASQALLLSARNGSVAAVLLGQKKDPTPTEADLVPKAKEDPRRQFRQALLLSARNGSLAAALLEQKEAIAQPPIDQDEDEDLEPLRVAARSTLLDAAKDGRLFAALTASEEVAGTVDEEEPEHAEEDIESLRLAARAVLLSSAKDGRLMAALAQTSEPDGKETSLDDKRREVRHVLLSSAADGRPAEVLQKDAAPDRQRPSSRKVNMPAPLADLSIRDDELPAYATAIRTPKLAEVLPAFSSSPLAPQRYNAGLRALGLQLPDALLSTISPVASSPSSPASAGPRLLSPTHSLGRIRSRPSSCSGQSDLDGKDRSQLPSLAATATVPTISEEVEADSRPASANCQKVAASNIEVEASKCQSADDPKEDGVSIADVKAEEKPTADIKAQEIQSKDIPTQEQPITDVQAEEVQSTETTSQEQLIAAVNAEEIQSEHSTKQEKPIADAKAEELQSKDCTQEKPIADVKAQEKPIADVNAEERQAKDPTLEKPNAGVEAQEIQSKDTTTQELQSKDRTQEKPIADVQAQEIQSEDTANQEKPIADVTAEEHQSKDPTQEKPIADVKTQEKPIGDVQAKQEIQPKDMVTKEKPPSDLKDCNPKPQVTDSGSTDGAARSSAAPKKDKARAQKEATNASQIEESRLPIAEPQPAKPRSNQKFEEEVKPVQKRKAPAKDKSTVSAPQDLSKVEVDVAPDREPMKPNVRHTTRYSDNEFRRHQSAPSFHAEAISGISRSDDFQISFETEALIEELRLEKQKHATTKGQAQDLARQLRIANAKLSSPPRAKKSNRFGITDATPYAAIPSSLSSSSMEKKEIRGVYLPVLRPLPPRSPRRDPGDAVMPVVQAILEESRVTSLSRADQSRSRVEAYSRLSSAGLSTWDVRRAEKVARLQDMQCFTESLWDNFYEWNQAVQSMGS